MKMIFDELSIEMSTLTTKKYSTSFSLGIKTLNKDLQKPIYAIYGFVRFADEIVDSFQEFNALVLLEDFKAQTYRAIEQKISLNPILNSFQWVVNKYQIPMELIDTFLASMEMDLTEHDYDEEKYKLYILGSAEVVGLMCLKVFVSGDEQEYNRLKDAAMKLGSAFQKINFLRDLNADFHHLGRVYFPGIQMEHFNDEIKAAIEVDIEKDFQEGFLGIQQLPKKARAGVYLAYQYYYKLFLKIKKTSAKVILNERIRIPNNKKMQILLAAYFKNNLNLL
ncbi:MAG: phytoene/squalene synthase family protein [Flavobacteriia bacterium]|nr:phytoene/squalene synthase family protein [Flavobacteriia bacterium]NBV91668.1 phytoene/squalene synthase family protein [Flavobacteriia bacterium]NBY41635.1 phytoene/squalene synthase family protein [Flavobacteriia bacterium]